MKKAFTYILTCALFCFMASIQYSFGQENEVPQFKKTAIYGNGGTILYLFTATGYLERQLWEKNKSWKVQRRDEVIEKTGRLAILCRAGIAGYATWSEVANYSLLQTGFMWGPGKHHFETYLGAGYFFGDTDFAPILPTGSIGYRRQMPNNNLVVRAGVGFPEGVYFGFGLCF